MSGYYWNIQSNTKLEFWLLFNNGFLVWEMIFGQNIVSSSVTGSVSRRKTKRSQNHSEKLQIRRDILSRDSRVSYIIMVKTWIHHLITESEFRKVWKRYQAENCIDYLEKKITSGANIHTLLYRNPEES